ncbi:unnamed protein product [Gordionus sp. m RMFG-2023]|uniref:uncharacterized protein LOC135931964 n=1 Tax=Gordionus sp. m RMFG-2023 TaxID=3053472 RepID=UPI0030E2A1C6
MIFGQLIIGAPGSGKTTYCYGMSQFLNEINDRISKKIEQNKDCKSIKEEITFKNPRKVAIINLDPANECVAFEPDIDVRTIVQLDNVMKKYNIGPNGAMLKCLEILEKNIDWLIEQILLLSSMKTPIYDYFLFDCPGQIELFTHHTSLLNIIHKLSQKNIDKSFNGINMVVVNLVDSTFCLDLGKYVASTLTSLSTMLYLAQPHVNILSKYDLIEKELDKKDNLHFDFSYFTDVLDLSHLVQCLDDDPFYSRFKKLNTVICEVIEGYSLVSYVPCNINDKLSVARLVKILDKALAYPRLYSSKNPERSENSLEEIFILPSSDKDIKAKRDIQRSKDSEGDILFPVLFDPETSKLFNDINFFQNSVNSNRASTGKLEKAEDILENFLEDIKSKN